MARNCRICCGTVTILLGICFIALGLILMNVFSRMIHQTIADNVVLKDNTESFKNWLNPPVPVHMQFWVYNVINKDEVVENGSKPVVRQIGPYTYREIRPKSHILFHDNGTLTYRQNKTYVFVPEMSIGNDREDNVTTVNLLYLTITDKFSNSAGIVKMALNEGLKTLKQGLFQELSVYEMIWGYRVNGLKELADIIKIFSPSTKIPYDIGLFADINGTDDGAYTIYTGSSDVKLLNLIDSWKGESTVPYWTTPSCRMINGSDGTSWHPFVTPNDTLYIFSSDLCRSIYVNYIEGITLHGVDLYRFTPPALVLANETVNPDNSGFCTPNCLGAGVLNVSSCKGAPVIMSQPHFYQGAQEYIDAIDGMNPIPTDHRTVLDIEPHTGMVLNAAKRLQVNVYIRNVKDFTETEELPKLTVFPVAWVNESASLDQASANKFKGQVMTPILITEVVQYGLIALGGLLMVIVLVLTVKYLITHRGGVLMVNLADESEGDIQYKRMGQE